MKTMKIHGNNGTKELNKNKKMIKEYLKNVKKMKMSIQERKKYVINLHKRGYTVRQIAQELHMSSRNVIEILRIHWRRQIFQKVLYIYLFDYQFKKVASRIILLFISTLMVVVHLSSESIHSFI